MRIDEVTTSEQREELQAFFVNQFPDIDDNAVPSAQNDHLYRPRMYIGRAIGSTDIVAGLLSCCHAAIAGATLRGMPGASNLADRHSWLDLLATAPGQRGRGHASALLDRAARDLVASGVRFWLGCVDEDGDARALRSFYEKHGFTTTAAGEPMPPLLGFDSWAHARPDTQFYFYKRLRP